jgi:hypothetical protein
MFLIITMLSPTSWHATDPKSSDVGCTSNAPDTVLAVIGRRHRALGTPGNDITPRHAIDFASPSIFLDTDLKPFVELGSLGATVTDTVRRS